MQWLIKLRSCIESRPLLTGVASKLCRLRDPPIPTPDFDNFVERTGAHLYGSLSVTSGRSLLFPLVPLIPLSFFFLKVLPSHCSFKVQISWELSLITLSTSVPPDTGRLGASLVMMLNALTWPWFPSDPGQDRDVMWLTLLTPHMAPGDWRLTSSPALPPGCPVISPYGADSTLALLTNDSFPAT